MLIARTLIAAALCSATIAQAGPLTAPAAPGAAGSATYTLTDIYDRLDTGAAGSKTDAFTEPAAGPTTGTGRTLDEVMGKAPAVDDANGATAGAVLSGKTFWGLRSDGTWGPTSGSMPTQTLSNTTPAVSAGYYNATNLTSVDTDLTAENIKSGVQVFGITGSYPLAAVLAAVPETGQTTSYAAGDDGALRPGVPLPSPRLSNNGNGTVTDNLTGLVWLTNANCAAALLTWATALTEVASLNSDGTMKGNNCGDTSNGGGHQTDWRLPSVKELHSLINFAYFNPALSNAAGTAKWTTNDPFSGVQASNYWSSTTYAAYTGYAWRVDLYGGSVYYTLETVSNYVWPVRGRQD